MYAPFAPSVYTLAGCIRADVPITLSPGPNPTNEYVVLATWRDAEEKAVAPGPPVLTT